MSNTVHGTQGLHKQAAVDHMASEHRHQAEHRHQVAEAAYFLAEHRGFKGGDPVQDWLAAEAQINAGEHKGQGSTFH